MKRAQLYAGDDLSHVVIKFKSGDLELDYITDTLSMKDFKRLRRFGKNADNIEADVDYIDNWLARTITTWNLEGDDGTVLPLTAETFEGLGIKTLAKIVAAIIEDMAEGGEGKEKSSETSGDSSLSTEGSDVAPAGSLTV